MAWRTCVLPLASAAVSQQNSSFGNGRTRTTITNYVMPPRQRLLAISVFAVIAVGSASASLPDRTSAQVSSWARAQIQIVVQQGVLGDSVANFRPQALLTQGDLQSALD